MNKVVWRTPSLYHQKQHMGDPTTAFGPKTLNPSLPIRRLAALLIRLGLVNEQKYLEGGWDSLAENLQYKLLKLRLCLSARSRKNELRRTVMELRAVRRDEAKHRMFDRELIRLLDRGDLALREDSSRDDFREVTFKHSGNSGDLIYALPAMKALSRGRPAKLYLKMNVPINQWSELEHPLGKAGLTEGMFKMLKPLLEHQSWLSSVQIHNDEEVDYDMDFFRKIPAPDLGRGSIAHWYLWAFPLICDLSQPWLEATAEPTPVKRIVLARSARYRNPRIDYAFLGALGDIDFVGVQSEFEEMRRTLPRLRFRPCADFLELAGTIKSARFFIGNQSFPFAIAEALKIPRILEGCPKTPVVIPEGCHASEAFFQPNFERLVQCYLKEHNP